MITFRRKCIKGLVLPYGNEGEVFELREGCYYITSEVSKKDNIVTVFDTVWAQVSIDHFGESEVFTKDDSLFKVKERFAPGSRLLREESTIKEELYVCLSCGERLVHYGEPAVKPVRICLNPRCSNHMKREYMEDIMKKDECLNEGFINESGLEFKDISSEAEREYCFPNGQRLYIGKPLYLHVSASGGHRLYTEEGWCYYVQPKEGWWIRWKPREGKPHFVK